MQRIVILGNAGSGKSTLAREVGARAGLPVVHLDRLFWRPGWGKATPAEFHADLVRAHAGERWVSEGNYHRQSFAIRLARADLVVWLDTPRGVCMKRVLVRSFLDRPRPDMADGCRERLDADFVVFLRYVFGFDRTARPRIEAERLRTSPDVPVTRLRGRRRITRFLQALPERVTQGVPLMDREAREG
ncbi:P-loop NTPase family protein [Pararhizobium mangrovi]|uniref:AAA family ATPase n=1 Tax=Pararhizobium mangrovi TaxID=2590452 RepID=A0A506UCB7_9HYPH|nr:AAA family ATPase [Pararhizobium mangrovi]TPW32073.1 AAA family ATPase [Pararhizobium mangrovi]